MTWVAPCLSLITGKWYISSQGDRSKQLLFIIMGVRTSYKDYLMERYHLKQVTEQPELVETKDRANEWTLYHYSKFCPLLSV